MKEFIVRVIDPEEIRWFEEEPETPELIRCKDCKNRKEEWWNCPCRDFADDDFFCASGKRKDGSKE